jgi:serine/threonine protein kinase
MLPSCFESSPIFRRRNATTTSDNGASSRGGGVAARFRFRRGTHGDARLGGAARDFLVSGDTAREGGRCGPYRLVRLLGRGGSGVVFAADRTDGAVEQRVAVKLLRYGAGHAAFRERFRRERQILANLQHAGIVHLLDASQLLLRPRRTVRRQCSLELAHLGKPQVDHSRAR